MQHRIMIPFRLAIFLMMLLFLSVCSFFSAAIVYALPMQASGWVEVKCEPVPEDFSDTATVVLSNTETGEYYTITCHKVNDYIGRLQLPVGQYQVEQTTTADNFAFEALTATRAFEITADMPAAQLITLQIIKHDASFTPPAIDSPSVLPDEGGSSAPDDILPPAESDIEIPAEEQESHPSLLDQLFQEPGSDEISEDDLSDTELTEAEQTESFFQRVVKVLIGTLVFVILVVAIAFLARHHFEQE